MPPVIPPPATLRVVVFLAWRTSLRSGSPPGSRSWPAADVYNDERSGATTTRRRSTGAFGRFRPFDLFALKLFLVDLEELAFLISD